MWRATNRSATATMDRPRRAPLSAVTPVADVQLILAAKLEFDDTGPVDGLKIWSHRTIAKISFVVLLRDFVKSYEGGILLMTTQ